MASAPMLFESPSCAMLLSRGGFIAQLFRTHMFRNHTNGIRVRDMYHLPKMINDYVLPLLSLLTVFWSLVIIIGKKKSAVESKEVAKKKSSH